MKKSLYNEIKKGNLELSAGGVLIPTMDTVVKGIWSVGVNDEPMTSFRNLVVTEGLNKMLDVMFNDGVSKIATWYCGIYTGVVTPALSWTSGGGTPIGTRTTESTAYDEATRQEWDEAAAASGSLTGAAVMSFTSNATQTITGSFLTSASAKNGTGDAAGALFSCANFDTARDLVSGDILNLGYTITLANA